MKKLCMLPKFIQSTELQNPIVRTKHIIVVEFRVDHITFKLYNNPNVIWIFSDEHKAKDAYLEIQKSLSDKKIILPLTQKPLI